MKLIYFGTIPSLFVATTTTTSVAGVTPQAVFAAKLQHVAKEKLRQDQHGDLLEDYNTLLTHPDTLTNFHDRYVLSLFIVLCEHSQQSADPTTPQVHVQLNTACQPIPDTHTEFANQRIKKILDDAHHPQIGRNARLEIIEAIRANNFATSGKWYVEQAGIVLAARMRDNSTSLATILRSPPGPMQYVLLCTTIAADIATLSPELVQEKARLMYDYVCRDIPETNREGDTQGIKRLKTWIRSSVSRVFVEALPADLASAEEAKTMIREIWNSFIAPTTGPPPPIPDINTIPKNVFNALRVLALNSDKITLAEFATDDDVCVNLASAFREGKTTEYLGFVSVEFFAHLCHRGDQPETQRPVSLVRPPVGNDPVPVTVIPSQGIVGPLGFTARQNILIALGVLLPIPGQPVVSPDIVPAVQLLTGTDMSELRRNLIDHMRLCSALALKTSRLPPGLPVRTNAQEMLDRDCRDIPITYPTDNVPLTKLKNFVIGCLRGGTRRVDPTVPADSTQAVPGVLRAWNNIFAPGAPIVPEGEMVPRAVFDSLRILLMSIRHIGFQVYATREELCDNMRTAVSTDRANGYIPYQPESVRAYLCGPLPAS